MKADKPLVNRLSNLARLQFEDQAKEDIIKDLNNILTFVEKLNELDTSDIEPLRYITEEKNILRKDEIRQLIDKEAALKNAPLKDSDYIKVPKVIKK